MREILGLALAGLGLAGSALAAAPETPAFPSHPLARADRHAPVPKEELPGKEAVALRKAITANPAKANQITAGYMKRFPEAACSVLRTAALAIPMKEGAPDVEALASLAKASISYIYKELPKARDEVKCGLFAVLDAMNVNGNLPDGKDLVYIVQQALPAIFANDPSVASVLMDFLAALYPHAGIMFSQLRAEFFGMNFASGGGGTAVEGPTTPPTTVEPPTEPPATQLTVPAQEAALSSSGFSFSGSAEEVIFRPVVVKPAQ